MPCARRVCRVRLVDAAAGRACRRSRRTGLPSGSPASWTASARPSGVVTVSRSSPRAERIPPPPLSGRRTPRRPRRARASRRRRSRPGGRAPSGSACRRARQRELLGLGLDERLPPLLREREPHRRAVAREGEPDDPADAELDAAAHERLAAPRKRARERPNLVHRHHRDSGQDTTIIVTAIRRVRGTARSARTAAPGQAAASGAAGRGSCDGSSGPASPAGCRAPRSRSCERRRPARRDRATLWL